MKVAACRIPEVTSPCQTLGAASLTCVAARPLVCHKHVCKGPFLASPKILILGLARKGPLHTCLWHTSGRAATQVSDAAPRVWQGEVTSGIRQAATFIPVPSSPATAKNLKL